MLGHCLFRCGGSAVLLTTDPALRGRAKMELRVVERTTIVAAADAHSAIVQREDGDGLVGISLSKSLPKVTVRAFAANMTRLASRILPVKELARFAQVGEHVHEQRLVHAVVHGGQGVAQGGEAGRDG